MASSAQSGGSSGGPLVPTVQRGIVKMVRTRPQMPTLSVSRRESGAGSSSPPARQQSLPGPLFSAPRLHFSSILRIPSLEGPRHGFPFLCASWTPWHQGSQ
ncbi:hypothetical protein MDA_GLEAN10013103 [Myotis davidii]|uniref:Uncharacterized protein n=1 Tax=Myotis davidii TaxID=225400 RepID=L5LF46_MYODS|nr:hypothetical protein MDA_GLEAN10013103 [Myotis davidii]